MEVAKIYQDELTRIKDNVKKSHDYFKENYDRFNEFRKFTFDQSLSNDDITLLMTLSKPQLEFNISEAYISRLLGEFSKQEPSISVSTDDENLSNPLVTHVVEQHLRHELNDSSNEHVKYEIYKEAISGGFSAAKVITKYANPMSMNQVIKFEKCYDPTLCGWDVLTKLAHKGDGNYCFELYPKSEEDFKKEFPKVNVDKLTFYKKFAGFNWQYTEGNVKFIIVADYYEKVNKKIKIALLSDNRVLKLDDYKKMLETWGDLAPPPAIVGEPRTTTITNIERYICIDSEVIKHEVTDYASLPIVFFDGNSCMIKGNKNGNIHQMTRPYLYHAKGAQRLKNFSGIALANSIENMIEHKFMVAKESLPKEEDWMAAYRDIQKANVVVYNAYNEENPDQQLPQPREIQRIPAPPEVMQAFGASDSLIQNILGSYDASLGINDNQLSGVAIVEGATQSNATAMPYIVSFLHGLERIAEMYVDLIPKYYKTPRTIPIREINGKKAYVKINGKEGIPLFYDSNVLNVKIEAGVSFDIQQKRALNQLISIMQVSPLFNQFMNEKGLPVLLDNIDIRGIDHLKFLVDEWLKELAKQKQMAMQQQQQQMQNNPLEMRNKIEMAKLQQKQMSDTSKNNLDMQKLKAEQVQSMTNALMAQKAQLVQLIKADTERFAKSADIAIKHMDVSHRHAQGYGNLAHKVYNLRSKRNETSFP